MGFLLAYFLFGFWIIVPFIILLIGCWTILRKASWPLSWRKNWKEMSAAWILLLLIFFPGPI